MSVISAVEALRGDITTARQPPVNGLFFKSVRLRGELALAAAPLSFFRKVLSPLAYSGAVTSVFHKILNPAFSFVSFVQEHLLSALLLLLILLMYFVAFWRQLVEVFRQESSRTWSNTHASR